MIGVIHDQAVDCVVLAGSVLGGGLREVRLVPWGRVESLKGEFVLDEEGATAIVEAFDKHGTPGAIDYEHQGMGGEHAAPDGRAPAAGWVHKLWWEKGIGLKAFVEWTDKAREFIRAGEYRYISPVLTIRRSDRRAVALPSVGLTNQPAIPRMERLAASTRDNIKETVPMTEGQAETSVDLLIGAVGAALQVEVTSDVIASLKAILAKVKELAGGDAAVVSSLAGNLQVVNKEEKPWVLKLREIAAALDVPMASDLLSTLAEILKAVRKLSGNEDADTEGETEDAAVAASVRKTLGLRPDASKDEIVLALTMHGPAAGQLEELVAFRAAEVERVAQAQIDGYLAANKLNPHDKGAMTAAMSLAREHPDRLDAMMANATPYAEPGRTQAPDRRSQVIVNARREFRLDETLQSTTSVQAYTDLVLRDGGFEPMTESERVEFSTV